VLRGHEGWVLSAVFEPSGSRVLTASSDHTARLWDAATGAELAVLRGHEDGVLGSHGAAVGCCNGFDPPGTRVLTASDDRTARLWDAATGAELAVLRGREGGVESALFDPSGARVLTASQDHTARLWDAMTGAELAVLRGHEDRVLGAVFDPSGARVLTASWDRTARIWRVFPTVRALAEHARHHAARAYPGAAQAVLPGLIGRHPLAVAGIVPI
jgi:WD40 repeat protein